MNEQLKHKQSIYACGDYRRNNPHWHEADGPWKARFIVSCIQRFLTPKNISLVDIGCGVGKVLATVSHELTLLGYTIERTLGIDIAPSAISEARQSWPHIRFEIKELTEISEHFTCALLIDVIEHVDDISTLIEQAKERCDLLVFHIPLDDNWNNRLRGNFSKLTENLGHIHFFSPSTCFSLMESHKLKVVDVVYTPSFRAPGTEKTLLNRLIYIPRLLLFSISPKLTAIVFGGVSMLMVTQKESTDGFKKL